MAEENAKSERTKSINWWVLISPNRLINQKTEQTLAVRRAGARLFTDASMDRFAACSHTLNVAHFLTDVYGSCGFAESNGVMKVMPSRSSTIDSGARSKTGSSYQTQTRVQRTPTA
jgi:hypothetical protein